MKNFCVICVVFVAITSLMLPSDAQIDQDARFGQGPLRVYEKAAYVDGEVNIAYVLGNRKLWDRLELTDEQYQQLESTADEYFQTRQMTFRQRLLDIRAGVDSGLVSDEEATRAATKAALVKTKSSFEIENLSEIFVPHQIELLQSHLSYSFLCSCLLELKEDPDGKQARKRESNFAKLFGVSEKEARKTISMARDTQEAFKKEIREVLYWEISSAAALVQDDSVASKLLGIDENREGLLAVSNIRLLIAQRKAWQKEKRYVVQIPRRTVETFATGVEVEWLQLTTDQYSEFDALLTSLKKRDQPALLDSVASQEFSSYSVRFNQELGLEKTAVSGSELYKRVSEILLPAQIDELQILDRWRILNGCPFTRLLDLPDVVDLLELEPVTRKRISKEYLSILEESISRLCEIQSRQRNELVDSLPKEWRERFEKYSSGETAGPQTRDSSKSERKNLGT